MKNLDFELIYNGRDISQLKTKDGRNIKKAKKSLNKTTKSAGKVHS